MLSSKSTKPPSFTTNQKQENLDSGPLCFIWSKLKTDLFLGIVAHTFNDSTWEASSMWISGLLDLQSEFQASRNYKVEFCLKTVKQNRPTETDLV